VSDSTLDDRPDSIGGEIEGVVTWKGGSDVSRLAANELGCALSWKMPVSGPFGFDG